MNKSKEITITPLIDYFASLETLNIPEKKILEQHLKILRLNKGHYFLEAESKCQSIGYVIKGVLRLFDYTIDGEEVSHCFIKEEGFVTDTKSFYEQTPSTQYIIAETPCVLVTFDVKAYRIFEEKITAWQSIMRKATEQSLHKKVLEKSYIISENATTRYLNFLKQHPDIADRVSLKQVANYLGMTKYSLSRIRKEIAKKDLLPNGNFEA